MVNGESPQHHAAGSHNSEGQVRTWVKPVPLRTAVATG